MQLSATIGATTIFVIGGRIIFLTRIFGIKIKKVVISTSMRTAVIIVMCWNGGERLSLAWSTRRYWEMILTVASVTVVSGE